MFLFYRIDEKNQILFFQLFISDFSATLQPKLDDIISIIKTSFSRNQKLAVTIPVSAKFNYDRYSFKGLSGIVEFIGYMINYSPSDKPFNKLYRIGAGYRVENAAITLTLSTFQKQINSLLNSNKYWHLSENDRIQ